MAILTLTPSRFAATTDFTTGYYAYAIANRPVRKLGILVTPSALVVEVLSDAQLITFDLVPNSLVDEAESFEYSVALFDNEGELVYRHDIEMPVTDEVIFDLVPVEQDPDSCTPLTLVDNS